MTDNLPRILSNLKRAQDLARLLGIDCSKLEAAIGEAEDTGLVGPVYAGWTFDNDGGALVGGPPRVGTLMPVVLAAVAMLAQAFDLLVFHLLARVAFELCILGLEVVTVRVGFVVGGIEGADVLGFEHALLDVVADLEIGKSVP